MSVDGQEVVIYSCHDTIGVGERKSKKEVITKVDRETFVAHGVDNEYGRTSPDLWMRGCEVEDMG